MNMTEDKQWKHSTQSFLQASYPERSRSQLSLKQNSPLPLKHSKSDSELEKPHQALGMLKRNEFKHLQIKKEDHTIRKILCVASVILLVILSVDVRNDIQKEKYRLELEARHCYAAYTENECDNPVEAMREKCREYHVCYATPTNHKIRVLKVAGDLVGDAARSLMSSAGLAGAVFLVFLVCAALFFAYKSSKEVMVLKKQ